MLKKNQLEFDFLNNLGVSKKAVQLLTKNISNNRKIDKEITMLESIYHNIPYRVSKLPEEFESYIWTLLGEISIPNTLGENIPDEWPVFIFPFALTQEEIIINYIKKAGFIVKKRDLLCFNELLHACLYGGQLWYDSLKYLLDNEMKIWNEKAIVLWIERGETYSCSLAAIARKLQLHLRPNLISYSIQKSELMYPGVIKAFHTPHLGNVEIHSTILKMKEWKC